MKLHILYEPDENDWIHVWCPDLPGCHSQGKTIEEAKANIKEAIEGYLEVLAEDMVKNFREKSEPNSGDSTLALRGAQIEAHYLVVAAK